MWYSSKLTAYKLKVVSAPGSENCKSYFAALAGRLNVVLRQLGVVVQSTMLASEAPPEASVAAMTAAFGEFLEFAPEWMREFLPHGSHIAVIKPCM